MIQANDRILFIGDSITDAFRRPEELNNAFQLGNGYAFLIASRLLFERPRDSLQFFNRGICGNGLAHLEERWETDCLALEPTLISILIGVNDTLLHFNGGESISTEAFAARYTALLQRTRDALPKARLMLLEPFLLACGEVEPEWKDHMKSRQEAVRVCALNFEATFVPLQDAFDMACQDAPPEYWAYDGIHATAAGFELIARQWFAAKN